MHTQNEGDAAKSKSLKIVASLQRQASKRNKQTNTQRKKETNKHSLYKGSNSPLIT